MKLVIGFFRFSKLLFQPILFEHLCNTIFVILEHLCNTTLPCVSNRRFESEVDTRSFHDIVPLGPSFLLSFGVHKFSQYDHFDHRTLYKIDAM